MHLSSGDPLPVSTLLEAIAKFIGSFIWPLVLLTLAYVYRATIARLLAAVVSLSESANKIKLWQIEIDRDIDKVVDKSGSLAETSTPQGIPKAEIVAAQQVGQLVSRVSDSSVRADLVDSQKEKMMQLAQEYETVRGNMPAGDDRTRMMNGVMARMRALAIPAKPSLSEFAQNANSAGIRLAAIAILQISPDITYLDWLVQRMAKEQPFVFFHASLALLALVRAFGHSYREQLTDAVKSALATLEASSRPDPNTSESLELSLRELEGIQPPH